MNQPPPASARPHACVIESLETRIAPAAVVPFTDVDGDTFTISTSKGTPADLTAAAHFTGGQLTLLDLSLATWGAKFAGSSVSIKVTKLGPAPANGLVNVGEIDATGIDLGAVTVMGDLGKILAGSTPGKVSVSALTADSLGVLGTATGAPDLVDNLVGGLGPLKVQSDINGVFLKAPSGISSISIGGSLIGGAADHSGEIETQKVGAVKIGGDIVGGGGVDSGSLFAGDVASFALGGSLRGGTNTTAGAVHMGKTAAVKIGGSILGNSGPNSAAFTFQVAASVNVGGSVQGGSGGSSGVIDALTSVSTLTVGGSIIGGPANIGAGVITCANVGTLKVLGDLIGGGNEGNGGISVTTAGTVMVAGSIFGKNNNDTGFITGASIGKVIVLGSIHGHGGALNTDPALGGLASGLISAITLGSVSVGGDLDGAFISVWGNAAPSTAAKALALKSVTVAGSVMNSQIIAGKFSNPDVQVGSVTVRGDWIASSLVVGVQNLGNDDAPGGSILAADNANFGDAHDAVIAGGSAAILAKIASISIGGQVRGTVGGSDHFGFVAEEIDSFKSAGFVIPLSAAAHTDNRPIGDTGDVTIHEI